MTHPFPTVSFLGALTFFCLATCVQAQLRTYTDQATFRAETGATNATGPLPDLGRVNSASVGSLTFSIAPGGGDLAIGAAGTLAAPDWYGPLPGNDIAQGYENLQVDMATAVYAFGFDFAQPDATMPAWGGTPVDSTFQISLYNGATLVGQTLFSAIPTDVVTFLGVWSRTAFSTVTIIDVTQSPFVDDDEYYGEFYTGVTPAATVTACTDKVAFLATPGATRASGPLPDLGRVNSAKLGSVTLGVGPGGDDLAIGPFATPATPDWCPLLPGHDIAQGYENLQVDMDAPVLAFGIDFFQPDVTMPVWGGTPVDSTYEMVLYADTTCVGRVVFTSIPVDQVTFLGVCSDTPFNRVIMVDITSSPFVDDDEYYGEIYTGPGPNAWTNLGYNLTGAAGDPLLSGTGPLTAGSTGSLNLSHAAPSQIAVLLISQSEAAVPFLCGTIVPWPPLATLVVATDPIGRISIPWSAWAPGLSGARLAFQYAIPDPAAVCGLAMSNALRADVP